MADAITVAATSSARIMLPWGHVLTVSGGGYLRQQNHRHKITQNAQALGPFPHDVDYHLEPSAECVYRIFGFKTGKTISDAGTSHNILADDAGAYRRMTSPEAKTVTFRPEATEALPPDGEWHIRNAAESGDVTLTGGDGVTLNPPAGGTLVLEPGMVVTVKRVAVNVFDVIGHTVAA